MTGSRPGGPVMRRGGRGHKQNMQATTFFPGPQAPGKRHASRQ